MQFEVVTDVLDPEDLWDDLRQNIDFLAKLGIAQALCFFGYSWGNSIYDGNWKEIRIDLTDILPLIRQYEGSAYGRLGDDNMHIHVPDLTARVAYSHETDIHLSYAKENRFVRAVLDRWESRQWLARGKYR